MKNNNDNFENIKSAIEDEEKIPEFLSFEDEEGNEHKFELLDAIEHSGKRYVAIVPYSEEKNEDDELLVFTLDTSESADILKYIESEEEFDKIAKIFTERLSEEFDIQE